MVAHPQAMLFSAGQGCPVGQSWSAMRAELATRHIRIFLDLLTGRLGWAEYGDDLAGEVIASGRYDAPESLDALYERALAGRRGPIALRPS